MIVIMVNVVYFILFKTPIFQSTILYAQKPEYQV